jgi:predicted DNA-binding transcriptional regulator YafY
MTNRKNLPKTALPRVYFIDKEIASGKFPNTKTLAKTYETGTATISRDIEFMRDRLDAPIEYDYFHKGYYYTEKTFRLPAAFTSADDMLALGMAKTLLSLYKNTPIYEAARQLVDAVTAPLEDPGKARWYENRIVVPPIPSVQFPPEVWQTITEALRGNRVLSFEYRSSWYTGFEARRVRPYQLLFDNGAWHLYGYAEERRGMRMFSLPRIRKISLSDKTFTLPGGYDSQRGYIPRPLGRNKGYVPESNTSKEQPYPGRSAAGLVDFRTKTEGSYFGAYSSERKQRYRINFYGESALRIRERQWAADQRIDEIPGRGKGRNREAPPEGVTLSFTSAQYGKVLELVLASGRDALPLEPPELVEDWLANVRDMARRARIITQK